MEIWEKRFYMVKLPRDAVDLPDEEEFREVALIWEQGKAFIIAGSFKRGIHYVYRRELSYGEL